MKHIVVTGSIAYDYLMRFPGRFAEHILQDQLHQVSLSFLVEEMTKHWGGVAANIAFSLGMMGLRPQLMGTVGRDFGDYRAWLEGAGVDTSTVRQLDEVFTASFFVNTDLDNNQIAAFYSGAMAHAKHYSMANVVEGNPDLVVISPNDPQAMSQIAQECRDRQLRFVYDPSQQVVRLNGEDLLRDMEGAYMMVVNGYESHLICNKTDLKLSDLVERIPLLIVTEGERGATIYDAGKPIAIPIFQTHVKDPTGGGDAFRAGFIRGLAAGLPLRTCGLMGALVATYALEHVGPQGHRFTLSEFVARYRQHFDDEGGLDILLQ